MTRGPVNRQRAAPDRHCEPYHKCVEGSCQPRFKVFGKYFFISGVYFKAIDSLAVTLHALLATPYKPYIRDPFSIPQATGIHLKTYTPFLIAPGYLYCQG
jgi:hypothetical protein